MTRVVAIAAALAVCQLTSAADVQQNTSGDCSPALAYVSGNVEIRCELESRALKELASSVMRFQKESKARNFETEQLVGQINRMLASVSAAQTELRGRVERQGTDIAGISQLISERLLANPGQSGQASLALTQTRAWPGEFAELRSDWRSLDENGRFASAYDSFASGQIVRAQGILTGHLSAATSDDAASALAHYLLGRLRDLQFQPSDAFKHYERAWRLAPAVVEYRLRYAWALQQRNAFTESAAQYDAALAPLRQLAKSAPERYRPLLASALKDLAAARVALRQKQAAEAAYREARDLFRELAAANPQAFAPDFATSLSELGLLYGDARRYREAESALLAADETYRRLAEVDRWQYEPALVNNLLGLAELHSALDRSREASADLEEAEERAKALAAADAVAFGPLLAATLQARGLWWDTNNKRAIESYRAALEAMKPAMQADPSAHEADFAELLQLLGRVQWNESWGDRGGPRVAEAIGHIEQAREIYARLVRTNRPVFEPKLIGALRDIGHMSMLSRRYEAADKALRAAKELVLANPDSNRTQLRGIDSDLEDLRNLWDHAKGQK